MSHPQFPDAPWVRHDLQLSSELLAAVESHALATYPSECCGFLRGPAADVGRVDERIPLENQADRYHTMDPETFPRTSRTYFKINEMKAARLVDESSAAGTPIKVLYHSHCDAGAYFSAEDASTFSQNQTLMWPFAFLVVSVEDGQVTDRKLWCHVPGTDDFEEKSIGTL
ncbi:MAG: Mov34/MPN/PAD-1 family protein [Myxococcota bacterium]